jgi:hypothetical protein
MRLLWFHVFLLFFFFVSTRLHLEAVCSTEGAERSQPEDKDETDGTRPEKQKEAKAFQRH